MKEEEVDKYFKDKFQQFAPVPSVDAWARLQNKMEPPQQKRSIMWVYYAAAAVTLTILSGALIFWLQTDRLNSNGNLARLKPITAPLPAKPRQELVIADISSTTPVLPETVEPIIQARVIKTTSNNSTSVSKPVKKGKKIRPGILVASNRIPTRENLNSATETKQTPENQSVPNSIAQNQPDVLPVMVTEDRVLEVIIKKDPVAAVALTSEQEHTTTEEVIKENISKKGRLVKNILKQARNLKNGEKVELSTLGLNANYRIDVESKLLKQKYTKVINL